MQQAAIQTLIAAGEGARVEFKSSFQKEVIETLTAFANTQGGSVLIGVSDAGQIAGVVIQTETIKGWINQCKQVTSYTVGDNTEAGSGDRAISLGMRHSF